MNVLVVLTVAIAVTAVASKDHHAHHSHRLSTQHELLNKVEDAKQTLARLNLAKQSASSNSATEISSAKHALEKNLFEAHEALASQSKNDLESAKHNLNEAVKKAEKALAHTKLNHSTSAEQAIVKKAARDTKKALQKNIKDAKIAVAGVHLINATSPKHSSDAAIKHNLTSIRRALAEDISKEIKLVAAKALKSAKNVMNTEDDSSVIEDLQKTIMEELDKALDNEKNNHANASASDHSNLKKKILNDTHNIIKTGLKDAKRALKSNNHIQNVKDKVVMKAKQAINEKVIEVEAKLKMANAHAAETAAQKSAVDTSEQDMVIAKKTLVQNLVADSKQALKQGLEDFEHAITKSSVPITRAEMTNAKKDIEEELLKEIKKSLDRQTAELEKAIHRSHHKIVAAAKHGNHITLAEESTEKKALKDTHDVLKEAKGELSKRKVHSSSVTNKVKETVVRITRRAIEKNVIDTETKIAKAHVASATAQKDSTSAATSKDEIDSAKQHLATKVVKDAKQAVQGGVKKVQHELAGKGASDNTVRVKVEGAKQAIEKKVIKESRKTLEKEMERVEKAIVNVQDAGVAAVRDGDYVTAGKQALAKKILDDTHTALKNAKRAIDNVKNLTGADEITNNMKEIDEAKHKLIRSEVPAKSVSTEETKLEKELENRKALDKVDQAIVSAAMQGDLTAIQKALDKKIRQNTQAETHATGYRLPVSKSSSNAAHDEHGVSVKKALTRNIVDNAKRAIELGIQQFKYDLAKHRMSDDVAAIEMAKGKRGLKNEVIKEAKRLLDDQQREVRQKISIVHHASARAAKQGDYLAAAKWANDEEALKETQAVLSEAKGKLIAEEASPTHEMDNKIVAADKNDIKKKIDEAKLIIAKDPAAKQRVVSAHQALTKEMMKDAKQAFEEVLKNSRSRLVMTGASGNGADLKKALAKSRIEKEDLEEKWRAEEKEEDNTKSILTKFHHAPASATDVQHHGVKAQHAQKEAIIEEINEIFKDGLENTKHDNRNVEANHKKSSSAKHNHEKELLVNAKQALAKVDDDIEESSKSGHVESAAEALKKTTIKTSKHILKEKVEDIKQKMVNLHLDTASSRDSQEAIEDALRDTKQIISNGIHKTQKEINEVAKASIRAIKQGDHITAVKAEIEKKILEDTKSVLNEELEEIEEDLAQISHKGIRNPGQDLESEETSAEHLAILTNKNRSHGYVGKGINSLKAWLNSILDYIIGSRPDASYNPYIAIQ